jgi:hypothetical protein
MPCVCAQCRQHWTTLGLEDAPASRRALHSAFRTAARHSHPDRFENTPTLRLEAEERFKQLQVAYRELAEHLPNGDESAEAEARTDAAPLVSSFGQAVAVPPILSFADAPGCFVAPHFPPRAARIAANNLGLGNYPLAMIDLAGDESFSRFFLLATHSIVVKDVLGRISLIWLSEMGDVEMKPRFSENERSLWRRLQQKLALPGRRGAFQIYRRDGECFCSLTDEVDDEVKTVLYRYLLAKKFDRAN